MCPGVRSDLSVLEHCVLRMYCGLRVLWLVVFHSCVSILRQGVGNPLCRCVPEKMCSVPLCINCVPLCINCVSLDFVHRFSNRVSFVSILPFCVSLCPNSVPLCIKCAPLCINCVPARFVDGPAYHGCPGWVLWADHPLLYSL